MFGRREQTPREELVNSLTHGIAIALSIAALTVLVVFSSLQGDPWKIVSFSIYGATLIALFTASTVTTPCRPSDCGPFYGASIIPASICLLREPILRSCWS